MPAAVPAAAVDQEDQAQHQGEVDAPMGRIAQQPEARGVVVKGREPDQQGADDPGRRRGERPEAGLRVERGRGGGRDRGSGPAMPVKGGRIGRAGPAGRRRAAG